MNENDKGELKDLLSAARAKRDQHSSEIEECYDYVNPSKNFCFQESPKQKGDIYDNTAIEAATALQTSTINLLIPDSIPWATIRFKSELMADDLGSLFGEAIGEANDIIYDHFLNSNFYDALGESLLDTIIGGTGCIAIHDVPTAPLGYESIPLYQLLFLEDRFGAVDVVFREHKWSKRDLEREYKNLPDYVTNSKVNDKFSVIEASIPHGDKFRYIRFIERDCFELFSKTVDYNPFLVWRWEKGNFCWGDSPVRKALPSIRLINDMKRTMIAAAEFSALGAWQTPDETFNAEHVRPGGVVFAREKLIPIEFPGNYRITTDMVERTQDQIKRLCLSKGLPTGKNSYRSATEAQIDENAFLQQVGQPARRFQNEFLKPVAKQAIARLMKRGEIQAFTAEHVKMVAQLGYDVSSVSDIFIVDINAAVKSASRQQRSISNVEAFGTMLQVLPQEATINIKTDKLLREVAMGFGLPLNVLRSEDEVQQLRDQTSQAQQAQQAISLAGEAGKAGDNINKALNGPVADILQNYGGTPQQ